MLGRSLCREYPRLANRSLASLLAPLLICAAQATDYFVKRDSVSPQDPFTSWETAATSIQDAVDKAGPGDTVWVGDGVYDSGGAIQAGYNLMNRVRITKAFTLRSVNGPETTIIEGAPDPISGSFGPGAVRGVYVTGNASIIGFTIKNGYTLAEGEEARARGGGGILCDSGGSIVSNCVFTANYAAVSGGAGNLLNSASVIDCRAFDNTAAGDGGGFQISSSSSRDSPTMFIKDCVISNNTAGGYGGGVMQSGAGQVLDGCYIADNTALVRGGGGAVIKGWILNSIVDGNVSGNASGTGGGGLFIQEAGVASNCVVRSNEVIADGQTAGLGGGVYILNGGLVVDCVVSNNTAKYGGGVFMEAHANNRLTSSLIYGNSSTASGGGMQIRGGVVSNCEISDNYSYNHGGGVQMQAGLIERSRFVNNTSRQRGGGLAFTDSPHRGAVLSSLFVGNQGDYGAGVYFGINTAGALTNCTVLANTNSTKTAGAGFYFRDDSPEAIVHNSIVRDNMRTESGVRHISNFHFESATPLPSVTYCCAQGAPIGVGNISADPRFIDAENGDYTPRVSSPCLSAALPAEWMEAALDLAGNKRIIGDGVDMGAFEGPLPPEPSCFCAKVVVLSRWSAV